MRSPLFCASAKQSARTLFAPWALPRFRIRVFDILYRSYPRLFHVTPEYQKKVLFSVSFPASESYTNWIHWVLNLTLLSDDNTAAVHHYYLQYCNNKYVSRATVSVRLTVENNLSKSSNWSNLIAATPVQKLIIIRLIFAWKNVYKQWPYVRDDWWRPINEFISCSLRSLFSPTHYFVGPRKIVLTSRSMPSRLRRVRVRSSSTNLE